MIGTTFLSNTADFFGGGGAFFSDAVSFEGGLFQNNRSGSYGAGFYARSTLILSGTQVLSNTVTNAMVYGVTPAAGGGGLALGFATVNHALFQGNLSHGRAVGLNTDNGATVTATRFMNNTALAGGAGGLYLNNSGNSRVVNSLFAGNFARDPGSALQISTSGGMDTSGVVEIIHTTIVSPTMGRDSHSGF